MTSAGICAETGVLYDLHRALEIHWRFGRQDEIDMRFRDLAEQVSQWKSNFKFMPSIKHNLSNTHARYFVHRDVMKCSSATVRDPYHEPHTLVVRH